MGIRDVAAAAGVSPTTVSHALSGARAINPDTRARVLREVERLGYTPDPQARGCGRRGRTRSGSSAT
ncbi:LacI family DNA-binding transcriptional regulator [Actinokineospora soli]|uniref:LacI family DNA-binding transcriptional regulator n=1 Tax=Actinokineospora soli TaxID=1048753 RepID=A0ABW2TU13_9PSEU